MHFASLINLLFVFFSITSHSDEVDFLKLSRACNSNAQSPPKLTGRNAIIQDLDTHPHRDLILAKILSLERTLEGNNFIHNRSLTGSDSYDLLGESFNHSLDNLRAHDIWIDSGSGQANAIQEFLSRQTQKEPPRVIGLSLKIPQRNKKQKDEIKALKEESNGKFEEIEEDLLAWNSAISGEVSLITDVAGPFSYALDASGVIKKYGELLKEGGTVYLGFLEGRFNIITPSNKQISVLSWLESTKGFKVTPVSPGIIALERTDKSIVVPQLDLINIDPTPPPPKKYYLIPEEDDP